MRMASQLQHRVDPASGLGLDFLQRIQIPRVDHEGLFTDGIGTRPQREPDMRVVQVIGRADAEKVDALVLGSAPKLLEVSIEPLDFGKEPDVERVRSSTPTASCGSAAATRRLPVSWMALR